MGLAVDYDDWDEYLEMEQDKMDKLGSYIDKYRQYYGKTVRSEKEGITGCFLGILDGEKDSFYVIWADSDTKFYSAVGCLFETHGFEVVE